ncbi:carbohydrate ABC transporter permease [Kribbella kalugense]|nr:carbohydrate ABC transporter permease [Kribbella kalugense]
MRSQSRARHRPIRAISTAGLVLFGLLVLSPIVLMFSDSLRSDADVDAHPLGIPVHPEWHNYSAAFHEMNFSRTLGNTVLITGCSALVVALTGSMCAWSIVRHARRWSAITYQVFVAGLALPIFVLITPLYQLMHQLNLLDSFMGIILAYTALGLPFAVFFFTSFLRSVSVELEEAATIDGCGVIGTYWHVVLPMLRPATATLIIFSSLSVWNDLVLPLILLTSDSKKTVTLSVYSTIGTHSYSVGQLLPTVVLGTVPLFVIFLILQRHIVAGIGAGATKG